MFDMTMPISSAARSKSHLPIFAESTPCAW